jgi:glyoxylase-like metal-dependent hydrolase (beta-lactamase superfamily II)
MKKRFVKILAVVAGLLALATGATLQTFSAAKLELPQVDVGELPPATPPEGMSISALPTGTYETPAALAFRGGSWSDARQFAMTALLVRHPKGNLLIDAGAGKGVDEHIKKIPPVQQKTTSCTKGTPAAAQLAANGIVPGEVAGIIPTHAHWDHVSGIDDFPGVPVMVHAAGKRFIESKVEGTELMNSFRDVSYRQYEFDGGPYFGFPKSHDVWGDGSVVIVPAPGHTPDSVIVFVSLPSGARYALVGDLVFQSEGIELPAEKPWMLRKVIGEDDAQVHRDIALIRAASRKYPQLHVLPAHDSSAFRALPVFPASAR